MTQSIATYYESILRVVRYVDRHLEEDLTIDVLADVALFSKFHFHRIFKGAMGETLNEFVKRRRLEQAVRYFKYQPDWSVTQIALRTGFNSPEHFSRSFKDRFGISPREFKAAESTDPTSSKNSKIYQELSENSFYHVYETSRQMPSQQFEVVIKDRPELTIATISETFGQDGSGLVRAYKELIEWAENFSWYSIDQHRFAISKDDIEVTPAEHYRMEFGIEVPRETMGTERIIKDRLFGGKYVSLHVKGDIHTVAQGWDHLYKTWLPFSGYRPMDYPAIEIFLQGPEKIGWEKFDLEIGFPVEKFET